MTILSLQFLGNLFLISTAVWMCLSERLWESPVCDQESVYYHRSKSCFRLFNVSRNSLNLSSCNNYTGGEYHSVIGTVANADHSEMFLRAYLQYLRVPRAVIRVYNPFYYYSHNSLRKFLDHTEFFSYSGKTNIRGLLAMSLAEALGTPIYWEIIIYNYEGQIICQADGAGNVSKASSCPSSIALESVSDSNVTLNITPGETKTQVKVVFSVYKPCTNLTSSLCGRPARSLDKTVFLVKPTNLTISDLEPSTRYRAHFEIDDYNYMSNYKCNETFEFTTDGARKVQQGEENSYNGGVVALSVLLVCSLCVIIVLATFYYRIRKSTGQENTFLSPVRWMRSVLGHDNRPKESTKVNFKAKPTVNAYSSSVVGTSKTPSHVGKDNKSQNKRNSEEFGNYSNVQASVNTYDVVENEQDAHVYEM